jgi:hypothetical protein
MMTMMNKIRINVGRVRSGLATKGLSNQEAAELTGTSRSSFDKILREGRCAAFMLGRIARVLEVPVWELVDQ